MTKNNTSNNFSNYVNQKYENRFVVNHFNPNPNNNYNYNPSNQMTLDQFIKLDKKTQLNSNILSEVIYKKLDNYFSYPPHVYKLRLLYQKCDIRGDSSYDNFIILKYIAFSIFILSCYHNYVILLRRNRLKMNSIFLNSFIFSTSITLLFVAKAHADDSFDKRFDGRKIREIEFFVKDTQKRKLL